jgi:tagatose-1,6-bisphosphate aldolase
LPDLQKLRPFFSVGLSGGIMQLTFEVEDNLKEIIDSPGAKQAVNRKILDLKTAYFEKLSRAPSASNFIGTQKH